MKYAIVLKDTAQKHLEIWRKSGQVKTLKKISKLFSELIEHPRTGTGQVEELKGNFSGYWSRRIDKKNRMIYSIHDDFVEVHVVSLLSHYSDK